MSLARFFDRVYSAAGRHLAVSRASLEAALLGRVVSVHCAPRIDSIADEWTAELLVNLLARLYPRVALSGHAELLERLRELALSINPNLELLPEQHEHDPRLTVCVGSGAMVGAIHARADGWVARVSTDGPVEAATGPANPYAAGAAACIAAAELFRRTLAPARQVSGTAYVSLLDYGPDLGSSAELPEFDLGEVAFVGVGAVGNSALWAMGRHGLKLSGRIWLVDPEALELSNLQRYVLARDADVGIDKTTLGVGALAGTALHVTACNESLDQFAKRFERTFSVPTVCVSIDNIDGRRMAQALLPRLAINGWTSDNGLGCSWHALDRDAACMACLYQPNGSGKSQTEMVADALGLPPARATELWITGQPLASNELDQVARHLGVDAADIAPWAGLPLQRFYSDIVCGMVALDLRGIGRVEAVPLAHQSALAGILTAAELVKRLNAGLATLAQADTLVVWDDVVGATPRRWTQPRARHGRCFCGDALYQEVYASKWR